MPTPMLDWKSRSMSPDDVIAHVPAGGRVFIHGAAATPASLVEAMCHRTDLDGLTAYHLHTTGECRFAEPEYEDRIISVSLFTGPPLRGAIADGRADFMPIFLKDIPRLFTSGRIGLDAAILQLSPPDRHGYCSLGTSVDAARAAADSATLVLAEINEQMPRTHGNSMVHISKVTAWTHIDRPLVEAPPPPETEVEARIGQFIADLVEDGSTLQLGIGGIPNAVLARLGNKHELGIHTEMFSDGVIDLIEGGVVTNQHKKVHPGRSVTSFISGTERLYRFVDDNPNIEFHPCDRTNDTALIRKNPRVVAINSAIEIDLSGQVCADSIGHRIFSGIGGQMDFIHGSSLSEGGKPVIAIPSTAARGTLSRIVPELKPGAGVVTTRGHVHWVVTEYGAVDLHGMTLKQRAKALISIAHPDFRSELTRQLEGIRHFDMST